MQTHTFDAYEFESIASSQDFRFAFARRSEFATLDEFVRGCPREEPLSWALLPQPVALTQFPRFAHVEELLRQFACSPEAPSELRVVAVLADDWHELELLLESAEFYLWFSWFTSA